MLCEQPSSWVVAAVVAALAFAGLPWARSSCLQVPSWRAVVAVEVVAAAVDVGPLLVLLVLQPSLRHRVAIAEVRMKGMQYVFPVYVAEANWLACSEAYLQ